MTLAGSLSLLLQQRCRDHLLAGLNLRYYCYKFIKVKTHRKSILPFYVYKLEKLIYIWHLYMMPYWKSSCQRLSTFSFPRHRPTQRLKMVLTCSQCCWRFLPVRCVSAFFYKLRQNQVYRNDLCLLYFLHAFCICKICLCASTTKGAKNALSSNPSLGII